MRFVHPTCRSGGIGRRRGLKILRTERFVPVRVGSPADIATGGCVAVEPQYSLREHRSRGRGILLESVTIGPLVISTQLAIPVVSVTAAVIVVRFLGPGSTDARRAATDAIVSVVTAFVVPWKLSPILSQTEAVLRDPRVLLVAPGGRLGTVLGLIGVGVALWFMWRRAGYPKRVFADTPGYPALVVTALAGAIAIAIAVALNGVLLLAAGERDSIAPDFALEAVSGRTVTLDDVRNRDLDVIVVNFWATWCVPCRAEMAVKERIYREFHDSVEILAVNMTASEAARSDVERFVDQWQISYPILLDVDGSAARSYGVRGTPTTVFLSTDGKVLERVFGPMTVGRARRLIRAHITRR